MVTNTGKVVEQKAVGICSTTFTRETLLNNLAKSPSTMNQPYRFNVATYFCVLTGCGVFDWCRWTFNVEKYVEKPPPELHIFAHIPHSYEVVEANEQDCLILSSCCVHGRERPVWSCGVVDWISRPLNEQPVAWSDSWSHVVQGFIRSPHYCGPSLRTHGFKLGG